MVSPGSKNPLKLPVLNGVKVYEAGERPSSTRDGWAALRRPDGRGAVRATVAAIRKRAADPIAIVVKFMNSP
jgi:hypothetical protein